MIFADTIEESRFGLLGGFERYLLGMVVATISVAFLGAALGSIKFLSASTGGLCTIDILYLGAGIGVIIISLGLYLRWAVGKEKEGGNERHR
jgi:hypothetical protein